MESTLFWIGCGLYGYGYFLRQLLVKPAWLDREQVLSVLHVVFWTALGVLGGFVLSASSDLNGPSPKWPILCGAGSLAWQLFNLGRKTRTLLEGDLEWVETSSSAIVLAAVIMYAVLQAFKIPSGSMEDTLLIGDHLFVNKFIYGIRIPMTDKRVFKIRDVRRGDVIVFEAPMSAIVSRDERERGVKKDFIKRAIGLPGDIIEVKNKQLYVNGQLQTDPHPVFKDRYIYPAIPLDITAQQYQSLWEVGRFSDLRQEQIRDNFGPVKVPPSSYFCMGDNRDGSFDSRFWGPMPNRLLKGKAWIVYFGWGRWPFGLFGQSRTWPFARVKVIT